MPLWSDFSRTVGLVAEFEISHSSMAGPAVDDAAVRPTSTF